MCTNFPASIQFFLILITLALISGCTTTTCCFATKQESNASVRYWVFGFGVVTLPKPNTDNEILATKMQSVGLAISNQPGLKMGLGYASSSVIAVPADTDNTVVEASTCASDDGIKITAKSDGSSSDEPTPDKPSSDELSNNRE